MTEDTGRIEAVARARWQARWPTSNWDVANGTVRFEKMNDAREFLAMLDADRAYQAAQPIKVQEVERTPFAFDDEAAAPTRIPRSGVERRIRKDLRMRGAFRRVQFPKDRRIAPEAAPARTEVEKEPCSICGRPVPLGQVFMSTADGIAHAACYDLLTERDQARAQVSGLEAEVQNERRLFREARTAYDALKSRPIPFTAEQLADDLCAAVFSIQGKNIKLNWNAGAALVIARLAPQVAAEPDKDHSVDATDMAKPAPLVLREGGVYITKYGLKIGPMEPSSDPDYPWRGWTADGVKQFTFTNDGCYLRGARKHALNLAAEWTNPEPAKVEPSGDTITAAARAMFEVLRGDTVSFGSGDLDDFGNREMRDRLMRMARAALANPEASRDA